MIGAVVIGRNEGERLQLCLESVRRQVDIVVYVDSGSSDNSIALAQSLGAHVVELDMARPFTAARARNAGWRSLMILCPDIAYIQFIDGDCELVEGWVSSAAAILNAQDRCAAVWGVLRERYPQRSPYNFLCDLEWRYSWPFGEVGLFGGITMIRHTAFHDVDGMREDMVAGEEPETAFRMRQKGWTIIRLEQVMAIHDASMTRFSQWWQRARRAGFAYAQGALLHGRTRDRYCMRDLRGIFLWGFVLPSLMILLLLVVSWWALLLMLLYPLSMMRTARFFHAQRQASWKDAWCYAAACTAAKFPQLLGIFTFLYRWFRRHDAVLIEYK